MARRKLKRHLNLNFNREMKTSSESQMVAFLGALEIYGIGLFNLFRYNY